MNHDFSHCLDYQKGKCPITKCFRAKLTEDLRRHYYPYLTSWMHYEGTEEYCLKEKQ